MKKSIIIAAAGFLGLVFLGLVFILLADSGNVAVIPVKGIILSEDSGLFASSSSSIDIVEMIEKADDNPRIRAIVMEINSPGGSAVASDEIGQALKDSSKPTIAWIRELGASGGYWIASNCDVIIANRMSITGSIGVISSYLDFSEFLDDYNITYQRLVAGKYKDIGSPYKELTDDERIILKGQLDSVHDFFIEEVAKNRNLTIEKTREIATGVFYIGADAEKLGLVDILGGKKQVLQYIEDKLQLKPDLVQYRKKETFIDALTGVMYKSSFASGMGAIHQLTTRDSSNILLLT